jgi:hypothetical protein
MMAYYGTHEKIKISNARKLASVTYRIPISSIYLRNYFIDSIREDDVHLTSIKRKTSVE